MEHPIFFFQPVQFNLQLTDLLVQLGFKFIGILLPLPPAIRKQVGYLLQHLLLPLADLVRVYPGLARYLRDRSLTPDRFQRYLRLECPSYRFLVDLITALLSLKLYHFRKEIPHLIHLSSFWGIVYYLTDSYTMVILQIIT